MGERVIEGTWEEVASRGRELAGRRVRVTVLDAPVGSMRLDQLLAPLIREAEVLASGPAPAGRDSVGDEWGEAVLEKFRRQGLAP